MGSSPPGLRPALELHIPEEGAIKPLQRLDMRSDPLFTKSPAGVLDHATAEIALGMKLDIATPRKSAVEGSKHPLGAADQDARRRSPEN
jgi:hypothetical protein